MNQPQVLSAAGGGSRGPTESQSHVDPQPDAVKSKPKLSEVDMETSLTPELHPTISTSTPFHESFSNDRIRVTRVAVTIAGFPFVIIERGIMGPKEYAHPIWRCVWESIPRGQGRAFVDPAADPATTGDTESSKAVSMKDPDLSDYVLVGSLSGLRKFGFDKNRYGYPEDVVTAIAVDKGNGECGHITAFTHRGEKMWFIGSKNVHIVVRYDVPDADISMYEGHRYLYATKIALLWRETMEKHSDPAQIVAFHNTLEARSLTGCFEAIFPDSQHLVDYRGAREIRFHALTRECPSAEGLCLGVEEALQLVQSFGLCFGACSPHLSVTSEEFKALLEDVARRENSGGVVMYGYSEDGRVVRLWKEKAHPYTMERAAREAIITRQLSGPHLSRELRRKLAMQPKEVRHYFEDWEKKRLPWMIDFAVWLRVTKRLTADMKKDQVWELRNSYLDVQRAFAAESNEGILNSIKVSVEFEAKNCATHCIPDVIMCVGSQGCGKSTLSRALHSLLRQAGCFPCWINQDEVGDRRAYLNRIDQAMKEKQYSHVILDKMNLDPQMRSDYSDMEIAVTVVWVHPDGTDALVDVCLERVMRRGEGHRSLTIPKSTEGPERTEEEKRILGIISQAAHACQPPKNRTVCSVNILEDMAATVQQVWGELRTQGTRALPDIESLDVAAALDVAVTYEELLSKLPGRVIYGAIQIVDPTVIKKLVPSRMLQGKRIQGEFHVTTMYFPTDQDPGMFVELARKLGEKITLKLKCIVSDAKAVAILVENRGKFPCKNKDAHITVATAPSVPPSYSNKMLDCFVTDDVVGLDKTTVEGVFNFVYA